MVNLHILVIMAKEDKGVKSVAEKVKMGSMLRSFNGGMYQDVTLSVTEECNLRCKYCYMVHKNHFSRMSFETAKQAVDEILQRPVQFDSVVWNFIGGEPTLEMELIDKITDYIKVKTFEMNHPWFGNSAFFIGSNGLRYESDAVQRYLAKNKGIASVGITIDGNKEKHDLQRVYPNGKGSYDDVIRNVKLWISQNPGSRTTKATYANDDLKYLKDSVISLWKLGIDYVSANVVFEDVWDEDAPKIFEQQLIELADYIIENELWDKYSVRFFEPHVGYQMDEVSKSRPHCGSGKMIAVSSSGKYYPCIRFLDFCMSDAEEGYCIGKIGNGINDDLLVPFKNLNIGIAFSEKCKTCKVSNGCPSCTGFNYDDSQGLSIYQRSMYHCEMHKAQVRANKYFWMRYSQKTGKASPYQLNRFRRFCENGWDIDNLDSVYILTSDMSITFCDYEPNGDKTMSADTLKDSIRHVYDNDAFPIVVTNNPNDLPIELEYIAHAKVFPAICKHQKTSELEFSIPVYTISDVKTKMDDNIDAEVCILNVKQNDIVDLPVAASILTKKYMRVNINKIGVSEWSDESTELYKEALCKCRDIIPQNGGHLNVMVPDDNRRCEAGYSSYTICPDGFAYACPAFYFSNPPRRIGSINAGILPKYREIFSSNKIPTCTNDCNSHCVHCAYTNLVTLNNVSTPANILCKLASIEHEIFGK